MLISQEFREMLHDWGIYTPNGKVLELLRCSFFVPDCLTHPPAPIPSSLNLAIAFYPRFLMENEMQVLHSVLNLTGNQLMTQVVPYLDHKQQTTCSICIMIANTYSCLSLDRVVDHQNRLRSRHCFRNLFHMLYYIS